MSAAASPARRRAAPKSSSLERKWDLCWLAVGGPELCSQHRFATDRGWKMDRAHPATRVCVELDGGVWSAGRHVRGRGFVDDCVKLNAAAADGWIVFRFPTDLVGTAAAELVKATILQRQAGGEAPAGG